MQDKIETKIWIPGYEIKRFLPANLSEQVREDMLKNKALPFSRIIDSAIEEVERLEKEVQKKTIVKEVDRKLLENLESTILEQQRKIASLEKQLEVSKKRNKVEAAKNNNQQSFSWGIE